MKKRYCTHTVFSAMMSALTTQPQVNLDLMAHLSIAFSFAFLRGDYRTGKRLNMRKVIAYIASQFRKDKIWLRRTEPSKRDYQVNPCSPHSTLSEYIVSQSLEGDLISSKDSEVFLMLSTHNWDSGIVYWLESSSHSHSEHPL